MISIFLSYDLMKRGILQMMEQYDIGNYETPQEFFALKAKRHGKFKKGGVVDPETAARDLINDWNRLV